MQSAGRRGAWQARSPLRRCARGSVGYSLLIKEEKMIKVPSCRCASCALIGQVCGQATGPQCLPAWRCVHAPVCVPCWSVQSLSRVMQSNPNPIRTWARVTAGVQRAALARHARRAEQAARSRVVAGRQSFGCIAMPDFLAALAKAVKPNGALHI